MNRFITSPRTNNGVARYSVLSGGEGESTTSVVASDNDTSINEINLNEELESVPNNDVSSEAPKPEHTLGSEMCIRVLDLNGKVFKLGCNPGWTVAKLKSAVAAESGIRESLQRLIYRGSVMADDKTLQFYKLEDGYTIHLFARQEIALPPPATTTIPSATSTTTDSSDNVVSNSHSVVMSQVSDGISGVVFPSDTMRNIDPLMLDTPLGNSARRVKLWSSFLLIVYTMKVLGQFALLAHLHAERDAQMNNDQNNNNSMAQRRYALPYYTRDPLLCVMELLINSFGVYVGCIGFKVAHGTNLHQVRIYCRGIAWLALLQIVEQIYVTIQIAHSDYTADELGVPASKTMREHQVTANVLHTGILAIMWAMAIHHAVCHKHHIMMFNETLPVAIVNPAPDASISTSER